MGSIFFADFKKWHKKLNLSYVNKYKFFMNNLLI